MAEDLYDFAFSLPATKTVDLLWIDGELYAYLDLEPSPPERPEGWDSSWSGAPPAIQDRIVTVHGRSDTVVLKNGDVIKQITLYRKP